MKTRRQESKSEAGHSLRDRAVNASELPKEVVMGMPVLTITGQTELMIENYRGIIEYTDQHLRIRTKAGQIRITGKRLQVEYYTNDDMKVSGRISAIEYLTSGGRS